jgi:hypothetical protein
MGTENSRIFTDTATPRFAQKWQHQKNKISFFDDAR